MTREERLMYRVLGLTHAVKDVVTRQIVAVCKDQHTADKLTELLNANETPYETQDVESD